MSSLLKTLFGSSNTKTVAEVSGALESIGRELAKAKRLHADAVAQHGEHILAATNQQDLDRIDAELAQLRQNVDRAQAAHDAVAARLAALQEEAATQDEETRWNAAEKAIKARTDAVRKVDKAVKALAAAIVETQALALAAFEAMPTKYVSGAPISPEFTDMDRHVQLALSVHSDGACGPMTGSELWLFRKQPQLVAVAEERAAHWLSARPTTFNPEPEKAA